MKEKMKKRIVSEVRAQLKTNGEGKFTTIQSFNTFLKEAEMQPMPKRLLGDIWREGESAILVAQTGIGKTTLSLQIARDLCQGVSTLEESIDVDCCNVRVYFIDGELSPKQQQIRYSDELGKNTTKFPDNLYRVELNYDALYELDPSEETDAIFDDILSEIEEDKMNVFIIDNLTAIVNDPDKAKAVRPLMSLLHKLKINKGVSILLIAHPPKSASEGSISIEHISGSKLFVNLADCVFALCKSELQPDLVFLKQLKARNTEMIYHKGNVKVLRRRKRNNFLGFEFVNCAEEHEHLQRYQKVDNQKKEEILSMFESGMSYRAIAKELKISHMSVKRAIKNSNKEK